MLLGNQMPNSLLLVNVWIGAYVLEACKKENNIEMRCFYVCQCGRNVRDKGVNGVCRSSPEWSVGDGCMYCEDELGVPVLFWRNDDMGGRDGGSRDSPPSIVG